MKNNFVSQIKQIFSNSPYRGWTESNEFAATLSIRLNILITEGYKKLVDRFLSSSNAESGMDTLFEIHICWLLLQNKKRTNPLYEPDNDRTPDFRTTVENKTIDIQIKRINQIEQESVKNTIYKEFRMRRFSKWRYSYNLEIWVSDNIEGEDINPFFSFFTKNLPSFKTNKNYYYPDKNNPLIRFQLLPKTYSTQGIQISTIQIGGTTNGLLGKIDVEVRRKKIERLLKKSSDSFPNFPSENHFNLVFVKPSNYISFLEKNIPDCLYGDLFVNHESITPYDDRKKNGLFNGERFKKITGVVFVPRKVFFLEDTFEGCCYPNELYLDTISLMPKPFEEMLYYILPEWRGEQVVYEKQK